MARQHLNIFYVAFLLFSDVGSELFEEGSNLDRNFRIGKRQAKSRRHRLQMFDLDGQGKADVVFIVDKSSKIKPREFSEEMKFINEMISHLPVFATQTRVAVVSVASTVKLEFPFDRYINKECTMEGVGAIRYTGGKASLESALYFVHKRLIFNKKLGARDTAKKIAIFFTPDDVDLGHLKKIVDWNGISIFPVVLTKLNSAKTVSQRTGTTEVMEYLMSIIGGDATHRLCIPGETTTDFCQRRCNCDESRKLVNCSRVRKQYTEMSKSERERYVQVVKTASTHPLYKEKYNILLTLHKTLFNTAIHQIEFFLPWHRSFILQYENLLREIDCRVAVPYWESMEEANDALASELWSSRRHGFGGNGTGESQCVTDGPFREGEWRMIPSAGGGCLKRNFAKHGRFPDCLTVRKVFLEFNNVSDFSDFHEFLHREYHDVVHCVIGGHMCSEDSASAPEFFLHHAFVDKLWWDWQQQSPGHMKHDYYTSQTSRMPSSIHFAKDFLDLKEQPGCVSVDYRDPSDEIYKSVKVFTEDQVNDIPRLPLLPYPENARKLFQLSKKEMEHFNNMRKILKPVKVLRENELSGRDLALGFRESDIVIERTKYKGVTGNVFQWSMDDIAT